MIFIAAVKSHIKYHVDQGFRIVVFRRYRLEGAITHKSEIMPLCGLYGQVLLFNDDSLDSAWEGGQLRMERWVFSEAYQPLHAGLDPDDWRPVVETELFFADLVIFDWSGEVTDNMAWEFERALHYVPLQRIVMMLSNGSEGDFDRLCREHLTPDAAGDIVRLPVPGQPVATLLFRLGFTRKMRSLLAEPRLWTQSPAEA
jgi:hypothetical protein